MRYVIYLMLFVSAVLVVAGCADFPDGGTPTDFREVAFRITFNGPVNDNFFYFIPIDITGGGQGPLPVFLDPDTQTGDEWVTGSATHYVQYHARQYTLFRITNLQPFASEPIGTVLKPVFPSPGGTVLSFSIDLNTLGATAETIDINIITLNQLAPNGRLLDGLGLQGSSFLNLDVTTDRTFTNSELVTPEGPGDVLNQNAILEPITELNRPLDIVDWTITTNV